MLNFAIKSLQLFFLFFYFLYDASFQVFFQSAVDKILSETDYSFHLKYPQRCKMTYGYIRVSTDKQTVENQRFEICDFCKKENLEIDGWIEETISGTKNYDKRKLGDLLNHVQSGDLIICAELSRLGRSLFMIMEILSICMKKDCKVWTIKDNFRLGDD